MKYDIKNPGDFYLHSLGTTSDIRTYSLQYIHVIMVCFDGWQEGVTIFSNLSISVHRDPDTFNENDSFYGRKVIFVKKTIEPYLDFFRSCFKNQDISLLTPGKVFPACENATDIGKLIKLL